MNKKLLDRLLEIRNFTVLLEGSQLKYRLVSFTDTTMYEDAIPGTPFRAFESVPQGRFSKRKQNDTMSFDPYVDTLFDYPLIVNAVLGGSYDALNELNWHLTIQVPYCGMDCWHCYNDKEVCTAGLDDVLEIKGSTQKWTAEGILEAFASSKEQGRAMGRIYDVLRVSGGEPFLAIELLAELLELIQVNNEKPDPERNPDYPLAIWTETNLITWAESKDGRSVVKVSCEQPKKQDLDIKSLLNMHTSRLIVHPCFHGLTDKNLQQCTGNNNLALKDLHSGFRNIHEFFAADQTNETTPSPNLYPTFIAEACDPSGVKPLFDFLYSIHPSYPLKLAVISVDDYEPLEQRIADRKEQEKPFFCYARHASLRRWDDMIKSKYGVAYGQILRPMADTIAALRGIHTTKSVDNLDYKPVLILLKSVFRDEYRQELLTALAAPPGVLFSTAYDTRHIDPSTRVCLKGGPLGFDTKQLTVLIVYSNPDSPEDKGRHLPLRWGTLKKIHVTDQLVHFIVQLDEFVSISSSSGSGNRTFLEDFSCNMREYFGNRILLERPKIRWVLLGEQGYILRREVPPLLTMEKAWDNLLSSMQTHFSRLVERSIFLQVLNDSESDTQESVVPLEAPKEDRILKEGDRTDFLVRYYIPKFDYYDKKPELNDDRSLSITSTDETLSIEGYECRPLAKYGEIHFSVVCGELPHPTKAAISVESKSGSPYCPSVEVPFLLKKANASGV